MRKPILIALTVAIAATLIVLTCQDRGTGDVEPMPNEFKDDSVRVLVGETPRWVRIRIGVNKRVPVFSATPSRNGTGIAEAAFSRRFRWAQILVVAPRSDPRDLPRFDIGTTGRQAAGLPATDPNRETRTKRTDSHDPFQRTNSRFPPELFHDSPTADRWESYVILLEITESGGSWSASIVKVWHWTFNSLRDPRNDVAPVDPTDDTFEENLEKARTEFGGAFTPGTPYATPLPPVR